MAIRHASFYPLTKLWLHPDSSLHHPFIFSLIFPPSLSTLFTSKCLKWLNCRFGVCAWQTSGGREQTSIVKREDDLRCPWITWWPFRSPIPQWSRLTTPPKSLLGLDPHFVVKKGLVLSEHSLALPLDFLFSNQGAGETQVHCSDVQMEVGVTTATGLIPLFTTFFFCSYYVPIESHLWSHRSWLASTAPSP